MSIKRLTKGRGAAQIEYSSPVPRDRPALVVAQSLPEKTQSIFVPTKVMVRLKGKTWFWAGMNNHQHCPDSREGCDRAMRKMIWKSYTRHY